MSQPPLQPAPPPPSNNIIPPTPPRREWSRLTFWATLIVIVLDLALLVALVLVAYGRVSTGDLAPPFGSQTPTATVTPTARPTPTAVSFANTRVVSPIATRPTIALTTVVPTAIPTPNIDQLNEQYSYSGTGDKVTSNFNLSKGIARFSSSYNGQNNFIVTLLADDGNIIDSVVNTIGIYQGETYISIPNSGVYVMQVKASGNWKVVVTGIGILSSQTASSSNQVFSGNGDTTLKLNFTRTGLVTFKLTHAGQKNFIVTLFDQNGALKDGLANELGNYTGEKALRIEAGNYYIKVLADGNWSVAAN